jgi:homotetrameric cytidine deaminase
MNWSHLSNNSYTPYSGKAECCVIAGNDDILYAGVRVENASYPLTMSAEQIAVSSCLAAGGKPETLFYPDQTERNPDFWQKELNLNVCIQNKFPDGILFHPLISNVTDIKQILSELLEMAVIPNSSFPVSALLHIGDSVISGVNVEFSEWAYGLCAERLAIGRAISAGYRTFDKLSLFVPKSNFASPCGGCRQVISEWMQEQPIDLYHGNGTYSTYHARELLPYALSSYVLKKNIDPV